MPTKIEWAEETWNPITGCSPVSAGCKNCYARRMATRLRGRCGYPANDPFAVTLHPDRLEQPLRWRKPRRVFVCSMGDLFHEDVPDEFIARIWWIMGQCAGYLDTTRYREHTFLALTKRPQRMKKWLDGWGDDDTRRCWIESFGAVYDWMSGPKYWPAVLPNVWLGVTAENQETADERIPILLKIPAAVRFVSVEPMLGPIDLMSVRFDRHTRMNVLEGCGTSLKSHCQAMPNVFCKKLDWVICGGESGPGARPMHPDWARSLRDQCRDAVIPFFFKQWGEWTTQYPQGVNMASREMAYSHGETFYRVGRKAAGRLLDGREWSEYPGGANQ